MFDANALRAEMARTGNSQGSLAKMLGISDAAMSYKIKNASFSLAEAEKIANFLDVDDLRHIFFASKVQKNEHTEGMV